MLIHGRPRQIPLALLERLDLMGLSRHLDQPQRTHRLPDAVRHPLHCLDRVLRSLPAGEITTGPPSSVLAAGAASKDDAVRAWHQMAKHLALGNVELRGAPADTWGRKDQTWYLGGDLAVTVEALVVLDERLGAAGLLPRLSRDAYLHQRIAAGDVARVALWFGTDPSLDLAFQSPAAALGAGGGPRIQLVRRPEDYPRAQRALASFIRPRKSFDPAPAETERPGILAARVIAEGQVRLAEVFAGWSDRAGEPDLAASFRARIPLYVELHRSPVRLVELVPTRSPLVVAQQSEMIQQLHVLARSTLAAHTLHDLDRATGDLSVNVGKTLRREGIRRRHLLVRTEAGAQADNLRPITNSHQRFNVACQALARSH